MENMRELLSPGGKRKQTTAEQIAAGTALITRQPKALSEVEVFAMSCRVKIIALILTVTLVFLSTPALFGQPAKSDPAVKAAQKYLDKGQTDKAIAVLREAAGRGDAAAMGLLGTI